MRVASVILDIPTHALDEPYSYLVPDDLRADASTLEGVDIAEFDNDLALDVGCAVLVPFGNRDAVGFVIGIDEIDDCSDEKALAELGISAPEKLKAITCVLTKPFFDEEGAACAQFLSRRYIAPLSSCIRLFTPTGGVPRVSRGRDGHWHLTKPSVGEVDDRWVCAAAAIDEFTPRKNAVKQTAIIDAVRRGDVRVVELALEFGSVAQALKTLEDKNVVRIEHRRRLRGGASSLLSSSSAARDAFVPSPKPTLTQGQHAALRAIASARKAANGSVVLVDGVTGSGKTEVYLEAIEAVLDEGANAIVLVPEIALTPQTVARFRGRFGDVVAVLHSRMSQGERFDQWDFIASGQARVVVGARSALFSPLHNVGLVVIDEEHESSYKQDSAPRYLTRDVAAWMMQRAGGVLVLGSATPSIEALHAAATNDRWSQVTLPDRVNGSPLPAIDVVDMAAEFHSGDRSMFSRRLTRYLDDELAAGHKVVLLLNQRGFAQFLLCRDCGFVPTCPSCSTSLTYHERGGKLMCHYCGYTVPVPALCPKCHSPYLRKFGAGTQRVETELRQLLSSLDGVDDDILIIRMDADTTGTKGAHQRLLEQFGSARSAVLLGTQMIAKGLDFEDVTLVGVINADTQLHLPDYRASERTFDLIEQVAGRAGRADLPGRVVVQTYQATAPAIVAAATYDRALFLRDELPLRRALGYPPYVRLANVLIWGSDSASVRQCAQEIHDEITRLVSDFAGDGWSVLPAGPCVLEKLRGSYRWHIVVKCPPDDDISSVLARLFRTRKADRRVNVAIDIDPYDLL